IFAESLLEPVKNYLYEILPQFVCRTELPRIEWHDNVLIGLSHQPHKAQNGSLSCTPLPIDPNTDRPLARTGRSNTVNLVRKRPSIQIVLFTRGNRCIKAGSICRPPGLFLFLAAQKIS